MMIEQINTNSFTLALMLTTIAGLSTVVGASCAVMAKISNRGVLSLALGISAGVMIFISFMEILPESISDLQNVFADNNGKLIGLLSFFIGCGIVALIDRILPGHEHTHCAHVPDLNRAESCEANLSMKRQGIMLAIAISIHNFPEGMATFISSLNGVNIALPIVIAIAIHNFPIGIAISIPIYQATGKRSVALLTAFLSGMAEPLGALIGGLILMPFWSEAISGILLAAVAGIMIYISFDELIPSALKYGKHHSMIGGVITGFILMALSLELF